MIIFFQYFLGGRSDVGTEYVALLSLLGHSPLCLDYYFLYLSNPYLHLHTHLSDLGSVAFVT
jgi:hypothetical protein